MNCQMIHQDPYDSINPRMKILDIVAEPLEIHQIGDSDVRKKRVLEVLKEVKLEPPEEIIKKYPHMLSGGQRQRVVLARALSIKPKIIVADEPVSMLDASVRADILKLFVEMKQKKNISFLFITHDLSLAWLISDRIAIMYLGKIVELGKADLIAGACRHPYSQALTSVLAVVGDRRKRKRIVLEGEIPSPINTPSGCRFHNRCPLAKERCKIEEPKLREIKEEHYVACHYPEIIK